MSHHPYPPQQATKFLERHTYELEGCFEEFKKHADVLRKDFHDPEITDVSIETFATDFCALEALFEYIDDTQKYFGAKIRYKSKEFPVDEDALDKLGRIQGCLSDLWMTVETILLLAVEGNGEGEFEHYSDYLRSKYGR